MKNSLLLIVTVLAMLVLAVPAGAAGPTRSITFDSASLDAGVLDVSYETLLTPGRSLDFNSRVVFSTAGGVSVGGFGGSVGYRLYITGDGFRGLYIEPLAGVVLGRAVVDDAAVNVLGARGGAVLGLKGTYSGFTFDLQAGGQIAYAWATAGGYGVAAGAVSPILAARFGYSW